MTTSTLVVAGDQDDAEHLTDVGPDRHTDPSCLAPAPNSLLIPSTPSTCSAASPGTTPTRPPTTDESLERVAALARLTSAYLRTRFRPGNHAWQTVCEVLTTGADPAGRAEAT